MKVWHPWPPREEMKDILPFELEFGANFHWSTNIMWVITTNCAYLERNVARWFYLQVHSSLPLASLNYSCKWWIFRSFWMFTQWDYLIKLLPEYDTYMFFVYRLFIVYLLLLIFVYVFFAFWRFRWVCSECCIVLYFRLWFLLRLVEFFAK